MYCFEAVQKCSPECLRMSFLRMANIKIPDPLTRALLSVHRVSGLVFVSSTWLRKAPRDNTFVIATS